MESKFGEKKGELGLQGMIYLTTVMVFVLFGAAFAAVLISGINGGSVNAVPTVILGALALLSLAVLIRQMVSVKLYIYENCLVRVSMFEKRVMPVDGIRAILWTFPGENPLNPRAARINNTSAEVIFRDGSKSVMLRDSYYRDMEKKIADFQNENGIPKTLESDRRGGRRY